ncbi:MAG TPA: hypothetical protein VK745_26775, partial [Polyangiaceae bacterium]|nr:hypothetical protein [Polyangiaceae bacterium]
MPQGGKGGTIGGAGTGGLANAAGKGGSTVNGGTGGNAGSAGGAAGAPVGGSAGEPNEGGAGGEPQPATSLEVDVIGVPNGQAVSVAISGPDGFSQSISATTTLSNLEPGTYTVLATPPSISVAGAQVDSILDAIVSGSGTVAAGGTATITITYTPRPGAGALWITNDLSRSALGFDATQLATTGAQVDAASVPLTIPNVGLGGASADALAFSSNGDLWLGYCRTTQSPQVLAK